MVGLAYNKAATEQRHQKHRRPVGSRVQGPGQPALRHPGRAGHDHAVAGQLASRTRPPRAVQKAVDLVKEQKDKGQIRRFTGNDYADDLAAGNIAVAQAYSGDVVQLQADNPDLQFVIPESGGDWFIDTMVIPYTTQNQNAAEAWINYVYDRAELRQAGGVRPVRAGAVGHDRRARTRSTRSWRRTR